MQVISGPDQVALTELISAAPGLPSILHHPKSTVLEELRMKKIEKSAPQASPSSGGSACASHSQCSSAAKDSKGCAGCASKGGGNPLAQQDADIAATISGVTYPLFVMSGKGGVGKSSVSVNLAVALAEKGFKVGLLDVDLHGPSVANLLGLAQGLEMDEESEKLIPATYSKNLSVLSMDSLLRNKDTAILWRGPKKTSAIRQFIGDVEWGKLDFLVIDSPPGTGDEHMTILKTIPNALCIVVTTPQEISLADVRKAMNFLQHVQGKVLGIVENMSGLSCPHCGKDIPLFKRGGGSELAKRYQVPFLGAIALDPATVVAADLGVPVVLLPEDSIAKRDFLNIADAVAVHCSGNKAVQMAAPNEDTI